MRSRFVYVLLLTVSAGLLIGCGPGPDAVATKQAQDAAATVAALPTHTSTPVPTSTPTETPLPTSTPTPIPTSAYIPDAELVTYVDFDSVPGSWFTAPNVHLNGGIASLDASENWDGIFTTSSLKAGQTVVIAYQFTSGTIGEYAVETGEYGTDTYRAWRLINEFGYPRASAVTGTRSRNVGWGSGSVSFVPDRWYVIALYIGSADEDFRIRLWAQDDPSVAQEQSFSLEVSGSLWWNSKITNGPRGSSMVDQWELIDGWPWPDQES